MTSTSVLPQVAGATADVAGREVARYYSDVHAEYGALRSTAMLVDRSHRSRGTFDGPRGAETLTGLLTNDVKSLAAGGGQYAAALTPKGKIIADVRVFALEGRLLVDVPARAAEGWWGMIRKYVNPRVAPYSERSDAISDFGVFGPTARSIVARTAGLADAASLGSLPPYGHVTVHADGASYTIARIPDLEIEGYELFIPSADAPALWQRLVAAGAIPAGLDAWEIARIEAGRPEWGVDMDDATIPQEANFDELHAISYTKGCYTGQETVARVHFRGHVNRHLRGLRFDDVRLPAKASLLDEEGKSVGDVRSVAVSPRLGGIALAMVRREVPLETNLKASWADGEATVRVTALPIS
jgi:tRNA-modifying protein YgfZ